MIFVRNETLGTRDHSNSGPYVSRLLELRGENGSDGPQVSWHDFFSKHDGDLFLLKPSSPLSAEKRDMILVRILGTKNDTRISYYLANVRRASSAIQNSKATVEGEFELKRRAWCVG